MRKIIFLVSLSLILSSPMAWSAPGETGAAFLKLGAGARGGALGGAHSASASGVEALYWNPAGLGGAENVQLQANYQPLVEDVRLAQAALVFPVGKGALGFGYWLVDQDPLDGFDDVGNGTGEFEASDSVGVVSFQRGRGDFKIAISGKFIQSKIDNESATAFAGDIGVQFKSAFSDRVTHSLVARHVGSGLTFVNEEADLPLTFLGGLSARVLPSLMINLEGGTEGGEGRGMGGIEWRPLVSTSDLLALRGGYSNGRNEIEGLSGFSLGAGFKLGRAEWNYAWTPFGDLGDAHGVSLVWHFAPGTMSAGPGKTVVKTRPRDIGKFVDGAVVHMKDGRRIRGRILSENQFFLVLGNKEGKHKLRKRNITSRKKILIRVRGNLGSLD